MSPGTIETTLRGLKDLPAPVAGWRVEVGEDATGDPAIWVWVTLETETDAAIRDSIRESVRDAIARLNNTSWVYVRFRLASESPAP